MGPCLSATSVDNSATKSKSDGSNVNVIQAAKFITQNAGGSIKDSY
jgi:hypothetical protein